jgi:hypothetical protein
VVARIASGELSFEDLSAAMKAFQGPPKGTALKLKTEHQVTAESVAMLMSGRVSILELFDALKTLGRPVVLGLRLKVASILLSEVWALGDSGSTHHVRPPHPGEDTSAYPPVKVELATGEGTLLLSHGGVLVGDPGCQIIVSLGQMVSEGWSLEWNSEAGAIRKGDWNVALTMASNNLPLMSQADALGIIKTKEGPRHFCASLQGFFNSHPDIGLAMQLAVRNKEAERLEGARLPTIEEVIPLPDRSNLILTAVCYARAVRTGVSHDEIYLTAEEWESQRGCMTTLMAQIDPNDAGRAVLQQRVASNGPFDAEVPTTRAILIKAAIGLVQTCRKLALLGVGTKQASVKRLVALPGGGTIRIAMMQGPEAPGESPGKAGPPTGWVGAQSTAGLGSGAPTPAPAKAPYVPIGIGPAIPPGDFGPPGQGSSARAAPYTPWAPWNSSHGSVQVVDTQEQGQGFFAAMTAAPVATNTPRMEEPWTDVGSRGSGGKDKGKGRGPSRSFTGSGFTGGFGTGKGAGPKGKEKGGAPSPAPTPTTSKGLKL